MILYKLLFRIAIIGFLSISIFSDEDTKKEEKEDGLEAFLNDLTHFPGLIDVYRNDDDGKVYFLLKKKSVRKRIYLFCSHTRWNCRSWNLER